MVNTKDPLPLPSLLSSQTVFEESIFKIRRDQLQIDEQPPYSYYTLITPPYAVAIVATTAEGALILNEEYRHPTKKILLGCPGGFMDPEENPLQAAGRELLEETGYQAKTFTLLGSGYPYAGFSGQKTYFIRAYEAALTANQHLDASEVIRTRLMMPEDLIQLIKNGVEVDAVLCAALFFYQNT